MASKSPNPDGIGDRLPDPYVRSRKPEPDAVPPVDTTLSGLLGDSDRPGRRRLYLTTRLDYYVEFSSDDVIAVEDVAPNEPPFPGLDATRVSLRRDARIDYVSSRLAGAADEFDLDVRGMPAPRTVGDRGTVVFCDPKIRRTDIGTVGTCDTRFFGTCGEDTCRGTCFEATCWGTCVGNTCEGTCGEATCGRVTCDDTCVGNTCVGETCRGTCGEATCVGTCGEATCQGRTCAGTCGEATCRGATCNRQTCATCRGRTCAGQTCFGTCGEATCFGTCGEATCEGQTCEGTCGDVTCAGTCWNVTCGGTCNVTCPADACGETRFFICQPTIPAERCLFSQQCR